MTQVLRVDTITEETMPSTEALFNDAQQNQIMAKFDLTNQLHSKVVSRAKW